MTIDHAAVADTLRATCEERDALRAAVEAGRQLAMIAEVVVKSAKRLGEGNRVALEVGIERFRQALPPSGPRPRAETPA